ncbi:MAG: glycosyltransferase [Candidatus Brocadiaceae bacterium]|nr:glycosyltransferase [Candidatus Brocadiaceae bacterium]
MGKQQIPLISIIIPVYKVENYLSKCVDSVLGQNFKNIEVILINDGSPDRCPEICDEYAAKDNRVRVIHKENGGLSEARNSGINSATGNYLMFLDSDDYWEGERCLENIVSRIISERAPDILVYGCIDFLVNKNFRKISRTGYDSGLLANSSKEQILRYFFKSGLFPGSAWITVTRREFIVSNNIYFIKGIKAEDIDWLLNVFLHAEVFDAIDDTFYIYQKYRTNSITGTSDRKSVESILFTIDLWYKKIQSDQYAYIKDYVLDYLAYQYSIALITYNNLDAKIKGRVLSELQKYSFLLLCGKGKKTKLLKIYYKLFGLYATAKTIGIFHDLKVRMS